MDEFGFILIGLAVIVGIPVLAIVAFVMVLDLRGRVQRLESQLLRQTMSEAVTQRDPGAARPGEAAVPPPAPAGEPEPLAEPAQDLPPSGEREPLAATVGDTKPVAEPVAVAAEPAVAKPGLEERLGTRWAVWVGGLALALGGLFLVRYSIESGLLGPGARVVAGLGFAVALIAFGEWLRRRERPAEVAGFAAAHIPGIVTAAGTVALFGTLYSAHALYGFIGPAFAFVALGAVGVATMAAAALHGPWLAGLGLAGAFGAPLLVSSDEPNAVALVIYLAVVTAAAFALARIRRWRWLAIAAAIGATVWGLVIAIIGPAVPVALHVLILGGLVLSILVVDLHRSITAPGGFDWLAVGATAAVVALALFAAFAGNVDGLILAAAFAVAAGMLVAAARYDGVAPLAGLGALLVTGLALVWPVVADSLAEPVMVVPGFPGMPSQLPQAASLYLAIFAVAGLALVGVITRALLARPERPMPPAVALALAATVGPLLLLAVIYVRLTGFLPSLPYGAVALVAAAILAALAEALQRRDGDGALAAAGLYAAGAAAALALAMTMVTSGATLTLGFALVALAVAAVSLRRDLTALRWIAAAAAGLVLMRAGGPWGWLGALTTVIPDWSEIAFRHGLPAIALFVGGVLLRRTRVDTPAAILDGAAILLAAIASALIVRRVVLGADAPVDSEATLLEAGLFASILFAASVGFARGALRTNSIVHRLAAPLGAIVSMAFGVVALWLGLNPALTGEPIGGGTVINALLGAYLVPAVLAGVLAALWRGVTAETPGLHGLAAPIVTASGVYAVISGLLWLTFTTRVLTRGADLPLVDIETAESYAYSAVWLVYGLVLLGVGLVRRSVAVRLASAAVILLTVAKVFLLDLAGLEGVYRALSFIGLGLVLMGIGLVYQRFVFAPKSGGRDGQGVPTDPTR